MFTAKVIESGQNQSVSIPREYRLNGTEVNISKIGGMDMLIASHAKAKNLILVTNNTKEFIRVQNIKLENWVM